jgi:hypothetical protein
MCQWMLLEHSFSSSFALRSTPLTAGDSRMDPDGLVLAGLPVPVLCYVMTTYKVINQAGTPGRLITMPCGSAM